MVCWRAALQSFAGFHTPGWAQRSTPPKPFTLWNATAWCHCRGTALVLCHWCCAAHVHQYCHCHGDLRSCVLGEHGLHSVLVASELKSQSSLVCPPVWHWDLGRGATDYRLGLVPHKAHQLGLGFRVLGHITVASHTALAAACCRLHCGNCGTQALQTTACEKDSFRMPAPPRHPRTPSLQCALSS